MRYQLRYIRTRCPPLVPASTCAGMNPNRGAGPLPNRVRTYPRGVLVGGADWAVARSCSPAVSTPVDAGSCGERRAETQQVILAAARRESALPRPFGTGAGSAGTGRAEATPVLILPVA